MPVNRRTLLRSAIATTAARITLPGILQAQTPAASSAISGTIRYDDAELRPTRAIDRVEVGTNGTACILYRGNAWLASIDG